MKKILLFTSILFLAFNANIKAQTTPTISNVVITDSIYCNGNLGELTINLIQSNPVTNPLEIVVGSFPFSWGPTYFVKITSASVLTLTTIVIPNLPPGDYTIRLVDPVAYYAANPNGNGTSLAGIFDSWGSTILFTEPDSLTATTSSTVNNMCFGDCIAEERLEIDGGTTPYSFIINGGPMQTLIGNDSVQDFVQLCADTFNVVVTDANGCSTQNLTSPPDSNFFIVTQPPQILPNSSITTNSSGFNVSCAAGNDGQITANAIGGTPPFEYEIDGGGFSLNNIFGNLSAGSYDITYRDFNNCQITETLTLSAPPDLSGIISITQAVSCFGICDGELQFIVDPTQVGVPPYQYSIDNGLSFQASTFFQGLCGDTSYNIMIQDFEGCQYTASIFLPAPNDISYSLIISDYTGFQISCNGLNDGQIMINTPTGGTAPYQYSSDGGASYGANNIFANLTANQYFISVIDFNGCTSDTMIDMTEPGPFTLTEVIDNTISCPEACDGAVSVIALNGVAPVNYSLSGGATQTTTFWNNLCGDLSYGAYDIDAIDANGCTATVNFSITEPPPFVYTLDSVVETCSMVNGQAIINYVSGGTGAWDYLWDDPLAQTTATAFNLSAGTYQVTVTDGVNCQFTEDVEVGSDVGFTLSFDSISPCLGGTEGSATVYANGAVGALSYLWGNGETTQTINNLPVGAYSVDVTDATGCVISGSVEVIPAANALMIDSLIISPITCHDANNASIQVLATGGQQFNPDGIANNGDEYYLYSNDNGFSNQTSIGFANLSPNTYIIHVEDAGNCIDRDTVEIVNPDLIEIDSTIFTSISCYGVNDGAIQAINVIGGTPPFEYSVNGSTHYTNMAFFNGYVAGTYTVEAYDIYNCTAQDIIIIEEPGELDVTITTSGWVYNPNSNTYSYQIRCNGDSSGFANIAVNGGTTPYIRTCVASNGDTVTSGVSPLISNLVADVYTFIVMDANGCTYSETITYNEPSLIVHNFIPTHVTCSGWSNGSLIDMISGGVGTATSYIYAWNTGDSTFSLTGIPIGTYTITVKDDNNCISVDSFTINDNNALSASTTGTNVSCYDYCDGVITTTVTGGLPNYDINGNPVFSYQWDDVLSQNTANAIGLCVDNLTNTSDYSCIITDGQGCAVTVTQTITQAEELIVSANILNEISCNLGSDGRLTASVTGGNGGNTYLWNNWTSWNGNAFNNSLTLGSYVVVVQDVNGCMDTTEITLNQPSEMTIDVSGTPVNCYGAGDGTITANASGGTPIPGIPPEYDYLWSNAFNEQVDISTAINLVPGIYTVIATDNNGCAISSESVYISEPSDALTITVDSIDESCELDDGQATAFVLGGTLPYTYNWNTGSGSNPIIGLSPGLYTVDITDGNGCTVSSSTFVNGVGNIFMPGNFSEMDTTICLGNSVFIDIEEKPTLTYRWVDGPFDGWQQADRWVTPTEPLNVYTLEITDPDCAPYYVTATISVVDVPVNLSTNNSTHNFGLAPTLFPFQDSVSIHTVSVSLDATIELFSDNNNCDTYNWTWVDGNSPTQYISVKPQESGWYYIAVESAGCLGFDSIYVIAGGIKPYDAFSPNNGDTKNNAWDIIGINKYPDAIIQVFNRWGAIIFEASGGNYEGDNRWLGQYNGKDVPVGTYYYIIDLKNNTELITGPITIVR